ncbi:MAG: hypothetical protein ABIF88_02715 [archaeon]
MENEEKSIFVEYFGGSPYIKILDFLIQGQDFDYGMTEIARGAEVGWSAFTSVWPKLIEKEIVISTRMIGNAKMFKLNRKNPFVQKLIEIDDKLTKFENDKILKGSFKVAV